MKRLADELSDGYGGELLVMNGNGGTVSVPGGGSGKDRDVGPASGDRRRLYRAPCQPSQPDQLDMGGTSTDVALIRDCQPSVSNEIEIEYAMPIHADGRCAHHRGRGGSIARVNEAAFEVGP